MADTSVFTMGRDSFQISHLVQIMSRHFLSDIHMDTGRVVAKLDQGGVF